MSADDAASTAMSSMVTDILVRSALDDLDRRHVVVIEDPRRGTRAISGPYADALTAAVALEREQRLHREIGDPRAQRFSVAPLLQPPPDDLPTR